jgi:hypothetical protein
MEQIHDHQIAQELAGAAFGDRRLTRRAQSIAVALVGSPGSSIPAAMQSAAATKATYRFLDAPAVTPEATLAPHARCTRERAAAEQTVLMIQDTTPSKFAGRSVTGLGATTRRHVPGIMLHTALCVGRNGTPLGILAQHQWVRTSPARTAEAHKSLPTEQKETQIWLDVRQSARDVLPPEVRMIAIGDREADFYSYIALLPEGVECVIRLAQDRAISGETARLKTLIAQAPVAGTIDVEIKRADDRPARTARLTVRYQTLEILRPQRCPDAGSLPTSVHRQVLLVSEENPPAGQTPISWLLLTSLPIESLEDATEIIGYYSQRWLIERFHYTLKSGMKIQELQLETRGRLSNAIALYSIVAWQLMAMLYHSRSHPDESCAQILAPAQWQVLYLHEHRRRRTGLPTTPPSNREAVLWIAKLGGFLARKGDGQPGIKVLWRGLLRLHERVQTFADTLRLAGTSADELMGNA